MVEDGTPDELQRWLAMIADANDEKVRDAAKGDETMRRMQKEMSDMVQDKEVRNMLMQEKYDRMDWYSYGDEKKAEGREEGRILEAVSIYREDYNMDDNHIIDKIMKRFSIDRRKAEKYVFASVNA